ncbi:MAG: recombinase family protein, partial [Luteibacter jiangsuensis]
GRHKGILQTGERKSLITDHTTLVLGPPEEVKVVRWIFRQSAAGVPNNEIARQLNAKGVPNANGHAWSLNGVRQMLSDERYIGTLVFARSTQAIGQHQGLTPSREIRVPNAFPSLLKPELFSRAKAAREARNRKLSDNELLDALRDLWRREGRITSALLGSDPASPTAQVYLRRFGSLRAAYRMIGYDQARDLTYGDLRDRIRPWRKAVLYGLAEWMEDDGSRVEMDGWVLRVDGTWSLGVRLLQPGPYQGSVRWEVRPTRRSVDLLVAPRMAEDGSAPMDYLILPRALADRWPAWVLKRPQAAVRFFSFPSLDIVRRLARISRKGGAHVSD